jgi:hypothetical protein
MITRRQFIQHGSILVAAGGIALIRPLRAYGANIVAASPALSAVQAAVNAASDGDHVLIPNGSATWTSGIKTTKQIIIRAQNYTPTPAGTAGAGTMIRNVTITNGTPLDSGIALFDLTSGNNFHCGVGGIRFNETGPVSGAPGPHIRVSGGGTKPPLIFDCAFQVKDRISAAGVGSESGAAVVVASRGGVMWNCYFSGQGFNTNPGNVGPFNACMAVKKALNNPVPPAWTSASTIGTLDTGGLSNFYMEDTTALIVAACPDVDEHGRAVIRRCHYNGAGMVAHGFTSLWGARQVEIYDCQFHNSVDTSHPAGQGGLNPQFGRNSPLFAWCRGGTFLMTNNFISDQNIGYGDRSALVMGDNTQPSGTYLIPRQPGCGHNGSAYVSDPIYVWNQTGGNAYAVEVTDQIPAWQTYVQRNRDYFVNNGAKPGYTKFTYPHPLRAVVEGGGDASAGGSSGGGSASALQAPSNLRVTQ